MYNESDEKPYTSRNMANGLRQSLFHILSDSEIASLCEDIRAIGADESMYKFNTGHRTSYKDFDFTDNNVFKHLSGCFYYARNGVKLSIQMQKATAITN